MTTVLIVIHLMLVLALIVLILLQRSEGGALGIGGGGGGGGGGFMSARGAANALTKTTTILAAGFFATSIALGVISQGESRTGNVIEQLGNQNGVPTGEGTDAGTAAPSAGNLLEDLEREGQPVAPTTSVPTSE
jgi:preprotein translocase subunit SecG